MSFQAGIWLFLCYSMLGWLGEVLYTAIRRRKYYDRGVLNGPLCIVYGVAGLLVGFTLGDLQENLLFLFLFGALYATVIEWIAGHILERYSQTRWWDYSAVPFNLDGYIALPMSAVWGLLAVVTVKWLRPMLLGLLDLMPGLLRGIICWGGGVLLLIDLLGTMLSMSGLHHKYPTLEQINNRLAEVTLRSGLKILGWVEGRMQKTYPELNFERPKREKSTVFAAGCSFYKIALLFFIGAFLGDITETIYCRITAGWWMSRSSVVWGPFSIVWGLALALVTLLLYRYKDKSAAWLFTMGAFLGGAYEYLCSVFTEIMFGTVFWDYSAIPFNLGGRINLLYCFFWGFAAVAWFKLLFPPFERMIEKIPRKAGTIVTWALVVFMTVNVLVSGAALARYNSRSDGLPAANSIEAYLDEHFDDARMQKIYPNAKHTGG